MRAPSAGCLSNLDDRTLLANVLRLAQAGRQNEVELLRYLGEVDERKLPVAHGHASLFAYCRQVLRCSESTASRYVATARAARRYSQIYDLLLRGEIHTTAVRFEADGELAELIDRAKEVTAHLPEGDSLASLFRSALQALLDKRDPLRRAEASQRRRATKERKHSTKARDMAVEATSEASPPTETAETGQKGPALTDIKARARYIPAGVRAAVMLRAGGRCEFVGKDGRRCTARRRLQVDHVEPFALGGVSTEVNGRILCQAHNLHRAAQTFGPFAYASISKRIQI